MRDSPRGITGVGRHRCASCVGPIGAWCLNDKQPHKFIRANVSISQTLVTLVSHSQPLPTVAGRYTRRGGPQFFFVLVNPIGASEVDPGRIEFKPGNQPIHSTLLREGPSPVNQSLVLPDPTYPYRTPTANPGLDLVPTSSGSCA